MLRYNGLLRQNSADSESALLLKREHIKRARETVLLKGENNDQYDMNWWKSSEDSE